MKRNSISDTGASCEHSYCDGWCRGSSIRFRCKGRHLCLSHSGSTPRKIVTRQQSPRSNWMLFWNLLFVRARVMSFDSSRPTLKFSLFPSKHIQERKTNERGSSEMSLSFRSRKELPGGVFQCCTFCSCLQWKFQPPDAPFAHSQKRLTVLQCQRDEPSYAKNSHAGKNF